MKSLTIKVRYGALGDHLLHSHLPRLAKQKFGYDEVRISNKSDYLNIAVKHLVWELNPYVDGFTDEDHEHPVFGYVPGGTNMLDVVAMHYGLDDGSRFQEPEIYYEPKKIPELSGAVIYEPNHKNMHGIPSGEQIERYFATCPIARTHQMAPIYGQPPIPGLPVVEAPSLEKLCDVIYSCMGFCCLVSGVATLAAALGKPATVLYVDGINPMFFHSLRNTYQRIT
jgi:hypothetical protein